MYIYDTRAKSSLLVTYLLASGVSAFTSPNAFIRKSTSVNSVPLANGKMSFNRVCREWRCKYEGDKSTSESLSAISDVVDEFLPAIKGVSSDVTVNRLVCGACLDFKLMVTVPLDDYGPWEGGGHVPESDFIAKLKAIEGVSQVETQTITNMLI
ncbi:hypothetical protein TrCOL_g3260 [Triparma columacea]|uniref:Uncharacterized protein n=1 Tax=Triparma columacea TaxID=722753 RepID=A0A9W7GI56_9STRA|nr:hypothetical protein TrCOL_g3260 [Triparma columacea]